MKKINKLISSIVLIALVSTALYTVTGVSPLAFASLLFGAGFVIGLVKSSYNFNTEMDKSVLYDGFVISDTTYAGEAASSFIVKAMTGNTMVQEGHIYVKDGIKKKFTIPRWDADYTDLVQPRQATPISKGTMTITGQTITPADYMIYTEFNPRDFEDHWQAVNLNPTLIDRSLPVTATSVIVQEYLKRHDRFVNDIIWNGSTALTTYLQYFDGLKKKATAASGTLKTGSAVTLTVANIAAKLQLGYDLIPFALRYDNSMKIFVSYKTFDLWRQYQWGSVGSTVSNFYKGIDITQAGVAMFAGIPIVKVPDFPDDYYMIAKGTSGMDSNLWLGLNSVDDASIEINKVSNPSELWYMKILMKADVQIGWNEETITYE